MHAGIGAAGADDGSVGLGDVVKGVLKRRLHRGLIGLALPSGIRGAVILKRQFEGRHNDYREALWSGWMKVLMPSKMPSAMRVRNGVAFISRSSVGFEMKAISARMLGIEVNRKT
jgi:hypothetical protein